MADVIRKDTQSLDEFWEGEMEGYNHYYKSGEDHIDEQRLEYLAEFAKSFGITSIANQMDKLKTLRRRIEMLRNEIKSCEDMKHETEESE